jgi:hypothetical protein
MSEYQYVDFIAIDGPVSDQNLEFMEVQSTRAEISPWRFTNEYHFGDFHGDTAEMLRRGYDAHLHFADFGIRRVMLRFPDGLPFDKKTLKKYVDSYHVTWTKDKRGPGGVLAIDPEADAECYEHYMEDLHCMLDRLAPLREMLMDGDLRPLFLAWLANWHEDDEDVPPIPAGLNDVDDGLQAFTEFYELREELIHEAAKHSVPAPNIVDLQTRIARWLKKQKKADLQDVAARLLSNDAALERAQILAEIRSAEEIPGWPTVDAQCTFGEFRAAAGLADVASYPE